MLENVDLSKKTGKAAYRRAKEKLTLKLGALQRRALERKLPVAIVFEGWDAAGKGTLINKLILPLDPRGFNVYSTFEPTEEEALRPFLWRFWIRTPERGRIAVFDRSWYRRVWQDRVDNELDRTASMQAFEAIRDFERQLADDGAVILKFFLHISKKKQKHRFDALRRRRSTAWRVSKQDLKRHKQYDRYLAATEDMLAETDTDFARWTLVPAHDRRHATLQVLRTVARTLDLALASRKPPAGRRRRKSALPGGPAGVLQQADLSLSLDADDYQEKLKKKQKKLRDLEHLMYLQRLPVVIVYEGWDAAGKGGNIRRLTQKLDPRGYEVVPVGAPTDIDEAHHYLWRFWTRLPKAGHMTIFDRSWYGRVLVERVEALCAKAEWQRAYHEINQMERHLTDFGTVVLKFWLHIDRDEQLKRFKKRQKVPYKRWKITEDDWRNREKWRAYAAAVDEMLLRTSTAYAPWTVVESNCKWYARIKVMDTVIEALERRLE